MSNNNINTRLPCNYKNKIIKALNSLETLKKIIKSDNRVVNIILEETILVQWIQIKKTNKYINKLLPLLKNTLLWYIPDMKEIILFIDNNFDKKTENDPYKYIEFIKKLLQKENISRNIRFIKYIINDENRCNLVFRKIN